MRTKDLFLFLFFCCPLLCGGEKMDAAEREFVKRGFPVDYAQKLAVLKKSRKHWQFQPLKVSEMNPAYTWAHIIHMETDDAPRRSLVSGNPRFSAYFHKEDTALYDAGFRRASREAVAYFLDPRNFLNEKDIFQFSDLSFSAGIDEKAVTAALHGTFMEKGKLENGKSYAAYLLEIGKTLNLNPVFLASRMRQEQGLKGTPLVSGKCGSLLAKYYEDQTQMEGRFNVQTPRDGHSAADLKKLDGLYNYFNMEASGTGRFRIYFNGMQESFRGSPQMTEKWGSPQWNTRWKAIYGGAFKIAALYIGRHQNTLYLQKWNVDPRSKNAKGNSLNFWGQYMQNIGAAFSEGRNMYRSLSRQKMLDQPFTFLIPVYSNMPEKVSADPADGECEFYRAHEYKNKTTK